MSKLADAHSKMEALIKEFNDFSQNNQSELNRLKDLDHTAEAKIVKLKDNFVKYDNHLQMALEEKLATFYKETEEALLLASQTPAAQEINKVDKRHEQQQAALQAEICNFCNTVQEANEKATAQESTLEEHSEGMVHCGTLIKRLCGAMRELEAQLAEVRLEIQEGRYRCNQAYSLPHMCLMKDLERALLYVNQLAPPTKMTPSHLP
ncbi:hypothetical protein DSO57_1020986 [Entomophthora muscae]|uniref:Uncharacterized protein n=1 Tax=Entomophthora muscae TaxID=34485 RepID=A0ACC2UP35_9FUNG|nr:hypothetical protein DSO57_1020986 [Entomophthora muscae]